jgi:hypothetical protein
MPISDFVASETRFAILQRTDPERAAELAELAQADADERWRYYEQLAGIHRVVPHVHHDADPAPGLVTVASGADGNGPATSAWISPRRSSRRPRHSPVTPSRHAAWRRPARARSSCRHCSRRRSSTRNSRSPSHWSRGPSSSPKHCPTSRRSMRSRVSGTDTSPGSSAPRTSSRYR